MNILILGGTIFLGIHLTEAALEKGHKVTLFHRGNQNIEFSQPVNHIIGDRYTQMQLLKDYQFDAVIDTSQDLAMAKISASFLKDRVSHYTYISSLSVYQNFATPKTDENAATLKEVVDEAQVYGFVKRQSELEILANYPTNSFIVRPGIIVGPYDPTDRFTYWVRRITRGGDILVPASMKDKKIQFIDARELAQWVIKSIENRRTGIYNVIANHNFSELLASLSKTASSSQKIVYIPDELLQKEKIKEWVDLPFWIAETNSAKKYFMDVSNIKAVKDGLKFRNLKDTCKDTYDWDQTRPRQYALKAGLSSERETNLLNILHYKLRS